MGKYKVTMPDGSEYTSDAENADQAHNDVKDVWAKDSQKDAPITSQIHTILSDPLNQIVHGMTAGLFDKGFDAATGKDSTTATEAGATRMGPVASGIARAGGAMALPSGAPGAVAAVGGGPLVRGIVGAGTAAAEGGAYGGLDAYSRGDDVPTGMLAGGAGGALGQTVANAAGSLGTKAIKAIKGIDDAAPVRNITTLPKGKAPSARDLVDVATAKAQSLGDMAGNAEALQAAQKRTFEKLATGKNKSVFTPTQLDRMRDVAYGDFGGDAAKTVGKLMSNPFLSGALGVGSSVGSGGIIPGLLTTGGVLGMGKALTHDSAAATQEAVDKLRQLVYKKKPYVGPLNPNRIRKVGQGLGVEGMEGLEDYLQ